MVEKIYLYKSDKPTKKFYIQFINPDTGREKKVYFGAIKPNGEPYDDYTITKNDEQKARYLKRHRGMGEDYTNIYTPGALSKFLLWNKPTISASIKDANERFGVKIVRKR
jgi:hypothetical protein